MTPFRAATIRIAITVLALLGAPRTARAQASDDPLARAVAIHLTGASVETALRAVSQNAGVRLSYSSDLLPASVRVTVDRPGTTVGEALREILRATDLGFAIVGAGHIVILRAPLVRAPADGEGPAPPRAEETARPQVMDRVLVMGTPVAGAPERGMTTGVAVLSSERIAAERTTSMADLVRLGIPGVVAWDLGASGPIAQIAAVRGSSSFSANYLKTYLDGVELASPYMLFAIEPSVIDRIEVIQGPQGSAMYGSDAISGVAHVITKKGTFGGESRPRLSATASGGVVESDFAAASATQHHTAAVDGGAALNSFRLNGTFSENGSYVTGGQATLATALGAGRMLAGPFLVEATARGTRIGFTAPVSPALGRVLGARAVPLIAAATVGQVIHENTFGATAIFEPRNGLRSTLVAGYDRNYGALVPQRNPASVADALLGASEEDASRASIRFSSSVSGHWTPDVSSTMTLGVEHSRLERERSGPASVIDPGMAPTATRGAALYIDTVHNTGAFAQWKLDLRDALYLSAGLRAEQNSSFGPGYGTAWSPMAGAAYIGDADGVTVKVRTAYGKGIRPPPPSARKALATQAYRQLENPKLGPESQSGIEGGIDLFSADRVAVSITAYQQRADGLIQHVLPNPRQGSRSIQQQNVGRIDNRGIEAEAMISLGPVRANVGLAGVASEVTALSKAYSGDLRVGDRLPDVPAWSGTAALSTHTSYAGGLDATVGARYVGAWTGYDWLRYYQALAGGAEASSSLRDYWIGYPSAVRPYLIVGHAPGGSGHFGWFARVDNLTNRQHDTRDNLQIGAGRTTSVGVQAVTP